MIDLWLHSGTTAIVLFPFVTLYLVAAGIVWLTHLSPARPFFASCIGIAGPFFASVAVLFGLFAAFLANDVQHRNAEIRAAMLREADGVRTIMRLGETLGPAGTPAIDAAVAYVQSVLDTEWPAMQAGDNAPENLGALRTLVQAVLATDLSEAIPTAVHQAMLGGLVEVRQARLERLTLTAGVTDRLDWLAMLILGLLTQVAVAVVQLERLRPQALALFVFTTAFAATVALIGLTEQSFLRRRSRRRTAARRAGIGDGVMRTQPDFRRDRRGSTSRITAEHSHPVPNPDASITTKQSPRRPPQPRVAHEGIPVLDVPVAAADGSRPVANSRARRRPQHADLRGICQVPERHAGVCRNKPRLADEGPFRSARNRRPGRYGSFCRVRCDNELVRSGTFPCGGRHGCRLRFRADRRSEPRRWRLRRGSAMPPSQSRKSGAAPKTPMSSSWTMSIDGIF